MSDPTIKTIGDSIFVHWDGPRVVLEFSRLTEHRDTLTAELAVTSLDRGPLHWSRINLASPSGRVAVVKALEDATREVGWRTILDRSCQLVARHWRHEEPAAALESRPPAPARWLVEPLMPIGETTVVFGDGGSGKSLFCLALAVSGILGYPLGGPWRCAPISHVLYLDWESDAITHGERLWGLTSQREELPPGSILHRRLWRPLAEDITSIRSDVDRHHIDLVIVDSLGAACGPEPESADAAVRTLMALRSLSTTRIVIAHVSKASAEQTKSRPFGSVYVQNLARSTVEVRRQESAGDEADMTVNLYHRKSNNGRLARASALTFTFGEQGHIASHYAAPDLANSGLTSQVMDSLRGGPKTVTEIAEELDSTDGVVRKVLHRLENRDAVVKLVTVSGGRGHKAQWGLADRNRDTEPF